MNLRLHPRSVAPAEGPEKGGPRRPTRSGYSCNNAAARRARGQGARRAPPRGPGYRGGGPTRSTRPPSWRCTSASNAGTHHIFFPPRLQRVVGEHLPHRLAPHVCDDPASLRFLGGHADRPPRIPRRRRPTHHRHDGRLLAGVQTFRGLRPRVVAQRRLHPAVQIAPPDAPHFARVRPHGLGDRSQGPPLIEQLQYPDPVPVARRDRSSAACLLRQKSLIPCSRR